MNCNSYKISFCEIGENYICVWGFLFLCCQEQSVCFCCWLQWKKYSVSSVRTLHAVLPWGELVTWPQMCTLVTSKCEVFPWHFCNTYLYRCIWKTTSEHQNLSAMFDEGFPFIFFFLLRYLAFAQFQGWWKRLLHVNRCNNATSDSNSRAGRQAGEPSNVAFQHHVIVVTADIISFLNFESQFIATIMSHHPTLPPSQPRYRQLSQKMSSKSNIAGQRSKADCFVCPCVRACDYANNLPLGNYPG